MAEKTKEQRIKKEKNRLNRIFKNIEKSKKDSFGDIHEGGA